MFVFARALPWSNWWIFSMPSLPLMSPVGRTLWLFGLFEAELCTGVSRRAAAGHP